MQFLWVVFGEREGLLPVSLHVKLNVLMFSLCVAEHNIQPNLLCSHWFISTGQEISRLSLYTSSLL